MQSCTEPPPHIASRATPRALSASIAQRESSVTRVHQRILDPSMWPTGSTLREVGGDAPTPRRARMRSVAKYDVRADAERCEGRRPSRRSARPAPTHAVRNSGAENPSSERGRPCTISTARSAQLTCRERSSLRRAELEHEWAQPVAKYVVRAEGNEPGASERARQGCAPPDSVPTAHGLRTKSSDQRARRVRHARAAHRHRTDERYDHHQGAKPRQGANRPDRTASTKAGRAPARTTAGASRPGRKGERPRVKALGPSLPDS